MMNIFFANKGLMMNVGLDEIKRKYLPNESLGYDREGIERVRQRRIEQMKISRDTLKKSKAIAVVCI